MPQSARVKLNNPALLTWAREAAGYDEEEFSRRMKQSAETICAWEEGREQPTYRQLQDFAKKVSRPIAALFLPEEPEEPPLPDDFRVVPGKERESFTPDALLAFRKLRNNIAELHALLSEMGESPELRIPSWRAPDEPVAPRADQLRDLLGVTFETQIGWADKYEALNEWQSALFECGVLVQTFKIPIEDVRAFSLLAPELGGIGINTEDAPRGRIFSLFHEVAHLCLRKPGVSGDLTQRARGAGGPVVRVEDYCDAFAAAFLLPHTHPAVAEALEELARDFGFEVAQRYAKKFKVSKYVIAHRLHDLDKVSSQVYWSVRNAWLQRDRQIAAGKKRSGGGNNLRNTVSHAGKRYVAVVIEAWDMGIVTTHEASEMLSLKPASLEEARLMAVPA